jgi:hypothetical protein
MNFVKISKSCFRRLFKITGIYAGKFDHVGEIGEIDGFCAVKFVDSLEKRRVLKS